MRRMLRGFAGLLLCCLSCQPLAFGQASVTTSGNTVTIEGTVSLDPSYQDPATAADGTLITFNPSTTFSLGTPAQLVDLSPNFTVDSATPVLAYLRGGGTLNQVRNPFLYTTNLVLGAIKFTSAIDGVAPMLPDLFFDKTTVEQTAGSSTTPWAAVSLLSMPVIQANGPGASLSVNQASSVFSHPALKAVGSGSSLKLTNRSAVFVHDVTVSTSGTPPGSVTLENNIGVDVENLAFGNNRISLRSVGPSVQMRHAGPARFGATGAPTSTLDVRGGVSVGVKKITSTYTITTSDFVVLADASKGGFGIILPPASASMGQLVNIIRTDSSGFAVMLQAAPGNTIRGNTVVSLPSGGSELLVSDGISTWYRVK